MQKLESETAAAQRPAKMMQMYINRCVEGGRAKEGGGVCVCVHRHSMHINRLGAAVQRLTCTVLAGLCFLHAPLR